jgi:hypothetical protein
LFVRSNVRNLYVQTTTTTTKEREGRERERGGGRETGFTNGENECY